MWFKTKEEIIGYAKSEGFKLDRDQFEDKRTSYDFNKIKYLRFVSEDDSLDEKELRWIWYKNDSDQDNILRGKHIKSRLEKKKQIQNLLKY